MRSTIRLFNALPVIEKVRVYPAKYFSTPLLRKTLQKGFILAPEIINGYSDMDHIISLIETELGLSGEEINATFHKSWDKIRNASMFQLVMEQIIHYITTYGFEALGIYDESTVYIPAEKLEIPGLELDNLHITVIRGLTPDELKERLMKLLQTGIALHKDTINDVVDVAQFLRIDHKDIADIRNKEVKVIMYDHLNIFPENPVEFLRYLVYKATENTLLIKNKKTIEAIKKGNNIHIFKLFNDYKNKYGLEKLATIFYRFKPLFLAFKGEYALTDKQINKIRKLAKIYHKPMPEDYLNSVTHRIKKGTLDPKVLRNALANANVFRKIRLAYALKYRTKDVDSIIYKVRNGRGYSTDFSFEKKEFSQIVFEIVKESIIKDISGNVKGKKIFIPKSITYALPATEKQFTGNLPSGTYVSIDKDMIFGVNWKNTGGHRIDLDLSLMNAQIGKIGWDSRYRTGDRSVLFSGDITDASGKNGATELFYVQKDAYGNFIMYVNYYNYNKDVPVPYKLLVAEEKPGNFGGNYMVNPNNIISIAKSKIDQKQNILGLLESTHEGCKFYYVQTAMGNAISSRNSHATEQSRKYLFNYYTDTMSLNEILELAGAELVDEGEDCDIDLSPESLTKDDIISLIT